MSFNFSIGDFIAVCQLAQDIYCGCFEPLRQELVNFQNTLGKLEDELDFITKDFRNGDEGLAVRLTDFQPTLDACRNLVEEIRRASNEHGMRQEISGESIREWRRRIVDCTLELKKMVEYHARVRDAVEYLNDQGIMEARSNASPDNKQSKNEVALGVPGARQPNHEPRLQRFFQFVEDKSQPGISADESKTAVFLPETDLQEYFADDDQLLGILKLIFENHTTPPIRPHSIRSRYTKVFAILLCVGRGNYIPYFEHHDSLSDEKLPFDQPPDHFPSDIATPSFFKDFQEQQWRFCAPRLDFGRSKFWQPARVLPITSKEPLGAGGSATAFKIVVHPEYNELDANRNNKKKNNRIASTPNFAKEKSNIKEWLDLYTGVMNPPYTGGMNPPDPLSFCVSTLALADIGCAHEEIGVYRDIIKSTSDLVTEIKDKFQKPVAGHLSSDDTAWIYGKVQQAEVLLAKANKVMKGMDKVVPQKRFRWVFQKRGVAESYKGAIYQCHVTLSQIRSSLIELQRQRYRESMSWEAYALPQSRQIANTLRQGDVRRSFATEHNRYLIETGVDTVSMFWEHSSGLSQVITALHGLNISKIASPDHPAKTISYGWHQDLKPENILTSEEEHGRWLISDFGLGHFHGHHKRSCSLPAKALTESDAPYHGTKHQPPTCIPHSFDIWSLGCVLLETGALLTTGSASALVINGYHGSLPSGNTSPIWAEDENRSPIIQLLTKILSKSSMTENIPLPRFITAPTPGEFITASLVYGLATTTFYYRQRRRQCHRQHQKRLDHSYSSSHEHYVLLAGITSPFALGHFLGLDTRGAVMQLMPWTILAALIIGATLHCLLSLAEQIGLRGKLGNVKVADVESSLGMDDSAARVKGGI